MQQFRSYADNGMADMLKEARKSPFGKITPRGKITRDVKLSSASLKPSEGVALRKFSWEAE